MITVSAQGVVFGCGLFVGIAIGAPLGAAITAPDSDVPWHHASQGASSSQTLQEDDPGWSCAASGDRVCGPNGDDLGHAPGCYNDREVLVAPWPCHVVVNPSTGEGDVFTAQPVEVMGGAGMPGF